MQQEITINRNNLIWWSLAIVLGTVLAWFVVANIYWFGEPERERREEKLALLERIPERTESERRRLARLRAELDPPDDWYNPKHLPGAALIVGILGLGGILVVCACNISLGKWTYVKTKGPDKEPRPVSAVGSDAGPDK